MKNGYLDFEEYIRQGEPEKKERAEAWRVAIGEQPNLAKPEQVPHKYPISTPQVQDKFLVDNSNIIKLISIIGKQELSVKEILAEIGLNDRKNVVTLYLNPAIKEGYIRMLYPNSLRHPKQKYLLTVKGLALYKELTKE